MSPTSKWAASKDEWDGEVERRKAVALVLTEGRSFLTHGKSFPERLYSSYDVSLLELGFSLETEKDTGDTVLWRGMLATQEYVYFADYVTA